MGFSTTIERSSKTKIFDPFKQTFNITVPGYGQEPISIPEVNGYVQYAIRVNINYASQIGASLVLLVVLLLITKPEKRRTVVFFLNTMALASNLPRLILLCLYYTSAWWNPYAYFAQDYSRVTTVDYSVSIAADVMATVVLIFIEASLVLQVKAVLVNMKDLHKNVILGMSGFLILITIGFRIALDVENCKAILARRSFYNFQWLAAASNDIITASVCFFSFIFIIKLGYASRERRKLGLSQFGPMQVLFIMGCQTLIIPAIFSILQVVSSVPELATQQLTVVAIFLPLSSLWASKVIQSRPRRSPEKATKEGMGRFRVPEFMMEMLESLTTKIQSFRGTGKPLRLGTKETISTESTSAASYELFPKYKHDIESGTLHADKHSGV